MKMQKRHAARGEKARAAGKITIAFTGGGTGGHIYPGLAVADELKALLDARDLSSEIHWIGASRGMDSHLVEQDLTSRGGSVFCFHGIPSGKLRRYFSLKNFTDLFRIFAGFVRSLFILARLKPAFLFSKGGFVSVPPCAAARILGIPYFTHECDMTPGLATRINSRGAENILLSYEETKRYFKGAQKEKCVVTGNPVREVFYEAGRAEAAELLPAGQSAKPVLLVLGGSLGARQINSLVIDCLDELTRDFFVVHQCGAAFAKENQDFMKRKVEGYRVLPFIYGELPALMRAADVIVSRAGANSIWECAVCARPMLLIPLGTEGSRGDQIDNAKYFESRGAAVVLAGQDATKEAFLAALERMKARDVRETLSANCRLITHEVRASSVIASFLAEKAGL